MKYVPEDLRFKKNEDNSVLILSKNRPIAIVDMSHPVWNPSNEQKTDEQYMKSIKLLGKTKKLEGIGACYQLGGATIPIFRCRETKDGTQIFYSVEHDSEYSSHLLETKRICEDKQITPIYSLLEYMKGFTTKRYDGFEMSDSSGKTTRYDETGKLLKPEKPKDTVDEKPNKPKDNSTITRLWGIISGR